MVERLKILKEIDQQLTGWYEELLGRLQEALEATAFSNRFLLPPRRLPQIAQAETNAFLAFLKAGDADRIREQGVKRAEEGLGEQAMLRLGTTLRQFCRDYQVGEALRAADVYADALLEGFMEGREAIVLREQEQIRRALQRVVSRYAVQLTTAAEVSRVASSMLEPAKLLSEVVDLIRDRFDFYYVGLFLLDEGGEYAVLRAGTGEAGRQMLGMGHKLEVGGTSMIGWCTAQGEARIALDVGKEAVRFDNPLLPETRSEMALPLISRGRVIGAMTIQSTKPAAFSEEDITTLQTMADQVANAIENAHLFESQTMRTTQLTLVNEVGRILTSILDVDTLLGQVVRLIRDTFDYYQVNLGLIEGDTLVPKAWAGALSAFPTEIARLNLDAEAIVTKVVTTGTPLLLPDVRQEPLYLPLPGLEEVRSELAVPLKSKGQVVGVLDVESDRLAAFDEGDLMVLEALAGQIAVAIENARLFEQTQAALAEVRRLATIVENHPDFIGVGTLDGQALYVNPAGLKMMGLPSDHDVTMMEARDFYLAEDAQKLVKEGIPAALEEGSWSAEATLLKADGTTIPVGQTIGINYDADGKPYSFSITMRDISERKAAEEALRVSEERFALAVRGTNDGLWDWDIQNDSLYWSPRLKELVGYADDELDVDFDTFDSFLHPDDKESTEAAIEAHLKDRGLYDVEQRLRTKSGEYRWFHIRGQAIWDEVGQPLRMVGSATDITDRKQAEAERERLFAEMEKLARELAVLNEMGRALTMMLDVDAVIEHLYQHASRLIDTTNFYVALYYPDQDEVDFPFYAEGDQRRRPGRRRSGKGMTEYVIQTREPLLIKENIAARLEELGIELIGQEAQSWLGVPMMRGEQVIGVIAVQSYTTPWLYNEHHRDLLSAIANQAAIAIENARLFEQAQARAKREQILREITTRVRGSTDPDTIVRAAVRELGTALGRPTFVRLGSAEQLSPTPQVQADDGKGSAQKGQHPEPFEGGE